MSLPINQKMFVRRFINTPKRECFYPQKHLIQFGRPFRKYKTIVPTRKSCWLKKPIVLDWQEENDSRRDCY